jgi:hypothetical protein
MQLLDDDMDELFRNAASQYPLKTDGADWDAVMRRLPKSDDKQVSSVNRLRNSKWLKWLLRPLLTLLVLGMWVPVLKMGVLPPEGGRNNKVAAIPVNNIINTDSSITTKDNNSGSTTKSQNNNIANTYSSNQNSNSTTNKSQNNNIITTYSSNQNSNNTTNTYSSNTTNTPVYSSITVPVNNSDNFLSLHLLAGAERRDPQITADIQGRSNHIKLRQDTVLSKPKEKVKVQKGLYAGILASPDFSTVKGQKVSNVGYNAGIIAGYRISRHLAVETGVLFERKYYYSEGSYFNTKKINPPADMKIINVDGWCKMIEIPLNVRYVFNIKQKSNWYVNAGVSSYIMSKESYDYKYEMYNTVSTRNWSYNNATRNWFSIIHVGVGYEHRLGGIGTLRVEPYLKIPAGGVGIGKLPLTSGGLNVGITRPIRF